ncbi:MAG: ATP-dependent protease subunit HslV [Acidobacteria bacterium]|nr:ATP-dependent protease subunit HslV [Acidobacteriota bacterium]
MSSRFHGTTVCCVRRDNQVALAGDGQVTLGNTVMKAGARKVRRMYGDRVLAGFAGSSADGLALFTRFEGKLETFNGNLHRAAVELASDWRTDKTMRHLEAFLIVANEEASMVVSGNGDVIEPDDGVLVIGSGGPIALSAARTLLRHTDMDAATIAREALGMAAEIDIYTNHEIRVETLPAT